MNCKGRSDLRHAAYLVRSCKRDHVRVGEIVVLRASTFDVLQETLRRYRDRAVIAPPKLSATQIADLKRQWEEGVRGALKPLLAITLFALFVALVASSTARASPDCMALGEARALYPNKYLSYRVNKGARCWDDHGQRRVGERGRVTERPRRESPAPSPPRPLPVIAPKKAPGLTVLWPTLIQGPVPDANLLTASRMESWPILLDVDDATADVPVAAEDECCWPPLDPPFRERWLALPSNWFFTAARMEVQP